MNYQENLTPALLAELHAKETERHGVFEPTENVWKMWDKNLGELMLHLWPSGWWVFRRGGDKQWVSMRKATSEDILTFHRCGTKVHHV